MDAGWLRWVAVASCVTALVACSGGGSSADSTESAQSEDAEAHHCAQVDGTEAGTAEGNADCEAEALGGDSNTASADANGDGSSARAVAGSLDLYDNRNSDDVLASDNNTSLALATHGAGALARSGVNEEGTEGVGGNSAVARADRPDAFADASAANGNNNAATSDAQGCVGAPDEACAFSAAGNGDGNTADALSRGEDSEAQAGALDGDHNRSSSAGRDGGRASSNAQGGNRNSADSTATGEGAFAASQASGGGSLAQSRADRADSTANSTARDGGKARALADKGGSATASATGRGFTAIAYASGAGTSASATHDTDTDTGSCSGPGIAYAMTGGRFHCIQGF
jgi:hypothetical protein